MNKIILLIFMTLSFASSSTWASMGRNIEVQGRIVKFDRDVAVLKDEKRIFKVPAQSVDKEHYSIGQWTKISVDLIEFYKLNLDKFPPTTK